MDHNAAAMLRAAADYIETHLGPHVRTISYTQLCGPGYGPGVDISISPAAWSLLATGQVTAWDAGHNSAEGSFRPASDPWLKLRATWTRDELTAAAPDVAAMVLLPTLRHSAAVWPGQEVPR